MKKLLYHLKDYKKECIIAPAFKLLEASFELFVPLVMAKIIDVGIGTSDSGYVVQMCLVMIALAVVGLSSSLTAQYYSAKAAVGFAAKLRQALFGHIQSLSFTNMDEIGSTTLITRITSDVNQVQTGVNLLLRLFLRSPFIVIGAMLMAFLIDVKSALIFAVTIPALSVVVFGIMLFCIPLYRKVQNALDKVLGITRENLTGARVIRAFNNEGKEREKFDFSNERLTHLQKFVGRISAVMNPVTYAIINAAIVGLLWTGAVQVNSGALTTGEVVALVNYMSQILVELVKLANLIITLTKSIACGNRIEAVLEEKDNQETAPVNTDRDRYDGTSVVFEHVSLTYKNGGESAVEDIDFTVRPGETVGIIGPTGSGKSTIVNMIPRFYDCTAGRVLVNGRDVKSYDVTQLRDLIGIVMQQVTLFSGTIRENILWGKRDASDEEILKAIETAQASDVVSSKEGGLDSRIEQGGKNLSGGQRQRLTIARALVKEPQILILDDSSSALDYATDANLRRAIRRASADMTVFIVSQRASSVIRADQILVMDDGRIAGMGTHEKLLRTCDVYREIYDSQYAGGGVQHEKG